MPNSYAVLFVPGVSLQQHKQAIGRKADLNSAISRVHDHTDQDRIFYHAGLDGGGLAAVRAELVVDFVECNRSAHVVVGL